MKFIEYAVEFSDVPLMIITIVNFIKLLKLSSDFLYSITLKNIWLDLIF